MSLKNSLFRLLKGFVPSSYKDLAQDSMKTITKQFFFNFFIALFIMILVFIPAIIQYSGYLDSQLASFDKINISVDLQAKNPIVLSEHPLVVADVNKNDTSLGNENLLITNDVLAWKKFYYFGHSEKSWDSLSNLSLSQKEIIYLLALALPSLLFWVSVFFLLKYFIIILLATIFAYVFSSIKNNDLNLVNSLKISIVASTVMVVSEMIFFPYLKIFWISLGLFVLFLAIGVFLISDKDLSYIKESNKSKKKTKKKNKPKGKSRTQEIFGKGKGKNNLGLDEY